jgi:hypothetical protein
MHSTLQKTSESKQQSKAKTSPSLDKKQDNTLTIDDQRPETAMQFKLMEGAEQSSRVHQLNAYQSMADTKNGATQRKENNSTAAKLGGILQRKEAANGLPAGLKAGVESLSGQSMSDVTVHRNSDKPAQLQAHAYAQGSDIHLGPGQEKHLPHEAWHVAQQKQGRVAPTTQLKAATLINDDKGLEQEADVMGAKALQLGGQKEAPLQAKGWENGTTTSSTPIQLKTLSLGTGKIQGFGTAIKNLFGKTTFTKLTEEVAKFNALAEDKQGPQGAIVKQLGQKWLDSHKDSKDPNDVLKKTAINQIMVDLKGDSIEKAVTKGIFKDEAQAASLEVTEGKVEQKKKEIADKGFLDESGKVKDKKGTLMDTSFMSDAESTMQSLIEKSEQNLGAIDSNERVMSSDAAIHMFFLKERQKAATVEERKGVTKHAENAYNSKFLKNILISATYSTAKGGTESKDELDAGKLQPYKDQSLGSAKEISNLNSEADNDLATLISYAQLINQHSKEEKTTKPENENEESVQTKRKDVLELLEDSTTYDLKVEAQKNKSEALIEPLRADGRLAGTLRVAADSIGTAAVSKVTQMVTMGLISASPKFMTGGVASSEGFELEKDSATGEFKDDVVHKGSEGESRFNFNGPRTVLKGIYKNMVKVKAKAAKFGPKNPLGGIFHFSGALKEFETGLGYIKQIVNTVKTWASIIGAAFPVAAPVTGVIGGVCEIISRIIDVISKTSKAARLVSNALVKIVNSDPELYALVSQNLKKSGAELATTAVVDGVESGFEAGKGAKVDNSAAEGVQDKFEMNPTKVLEKAAKEKSGAEYGFEAGAKTLEVGTEPASEKAAETLAGETGKGKKSGTAKPRVISTKALQSTLAAVVPTRNIVKQNSITLVGAASDPAIADPQQITSAIDQETTKLKTDGADPAAVSAKLEDATAKKEEASRAAEVGGGVKEIGIEVIKAGNVKAHIARIEAAVAEGEKQRVLRESQRGYNTR